MSKSNLKGRPIDLDKQQCQKMRLVQAARELLAQKAYDEITIRDLADQAKLNSAMISYYFSNKEGLFLSLLEAMSEEHFVNLQKLQNQKSPIHVFIRFMSTMLDKNPEFVRLVQDEFANNNANLGKAFIDRFPKRMAKLLPELILNNTSITDPVMAKYSAFSLMSMIAMPYVGKFVRQQAWEINDEALRSADWTDQIYKIFMFGCNSD